MARGGYLWVAYFRPVSASAGFARSGGTVVWRPRGLSLQKSLQIVRLRLRFASVTTARTTWLDRTVAIPEASALLGPDFTHVGRRAEYEGRLLDRLASIDSVSVGKSTIYGQQVELGSGFAYSSDVDRAVVHYRLPTSQELVSGEQPAVRLVADVRQYRELVGHCIAGLEIMLDLLAETGHRCEVRRLGLAAFAHLDWASLPPGVQALSKHIGGVWQAEELPELNVHLVVPVDKREGAFDRCVHTLKHMENQEFGELGLSFHRHFAPAKVFSTDDIAPQLQALLERALTYFEQFAAGDFNAST